MVPLSVRSNYSLCIGGSTIAALIARAKALGFHAMALADVRSLSGAAKFFAEAKRAGLAPIIGAEVGGTILLTRGREGFANLSTILSRTLLERPLDLGDFQKDLWFLTDDPAAARALRPQVDRLALEVVPGMGPTREREVHAAAKELGAPLLASPRASFAAPADFRTHQVLTAIRELKTLPNVVCDPERYLRRIDPDFPDASERIAADCAWDFLPAPVIFPGCDVPDGETAFSFLYQLCHAGLRKRYHPVTPEALERLSRELAVIQKLGFAGYFLVVHEIVKHARVSGAPVAGRGSGASSLVAYVLGITNVCPLRYKLKFERFLHEGRSDYPDLDLDFCWRTRDSVIDYAFERFGRDRVAMVSSMITFQGRSAFRETAKAHGLSDEQVTRLRDALPDTGPITDAVRRRLPIDPARLDAIAADATRVLGYPHYFSVHPGGIVLGNGPIERHTPVQRAEKGVVISQFDKDGVEAIGLVKIDLLGNRGVSTLKYAAQLAGVLDTDAIPDRDPATVAILREGRTIGVNQLESPAMRHLLRMMQPGGIADVMKALALIRPGAASDGFKERFVRRHRGMEPWTVDERLRPILADTYGVMIYEDDTMLVASTLTGIPLADADRFRKRVQKLRTDDERTALSLEFLEKCAKAGTPLALAKEMWAQIAKFNEYSFCMSHAASYAQLAYAVAWMRAHHPAEFWCSALNNNQGMYEKRVYVDQARRDGIATLLPDVNRSGVEFTLEGGGLRMGLDLVAGLSQKTIERILAERPFATLWDVLERARPSQPEAKALAQCGALDVLGRPRPELWMQAAASLRAGRPVPVPAVPDLEDRAKACLEFEITGISPRMHLRRLLAPDVDAPASAEVLMPASVGRRVRLVGVLDALRRVDTQLSAGDRWRGQWRAWAERGGPSARTMEFITLEDESGVFECTLFPQAYAKFSAVVRNHGPFEVEGTVEDQLGAVTLNVDRIRHVRDRRGSPSALLRIV
jgi:DNA polymerase-3 subunit alpha/error-prone DNA polymerase